MFAELRVEFRCAFEVVVDIEETMRGAHNAA
jgi:hypothetical protein